jgi:uncharacterized LabA/DUF88 family protein
VAGSYAIFVDAAFLWASAGELLYGTIDRTRLSCNYESLVEALIRRTSDSTSRDLLRVYWYDGAINKVPTPDQKRVGLLPSVKLRLGRIVGGHQKGVDSLIVLDLLKLAGTGMVETIYLISGDDDLTEGVREAQACGVRVLLLGAATPVPRQSEAMVLEADGVELWDADFWAPHFSRASTPEVSVAAIDGDRTAPAEAVHTFERVGFAFAARWLREAPPGDVARVTRSRPRIPSDIDARLLWDTSAGRDLSEGERVALRDGFWRAFDTRDDVVAGYGQLDDQDDDLRNRDGADDDFDDDDDYDDDDDLDDDYDDEDDDDDDDDYDDEDDEDEDDNLDVKATDGRPGTTVTPPNPVHRV